MYLVHQIKEVRDYWTALWYNLAQGNAGELERYQRMEITQFWKIVDLYEEKLQKEIEANKTLQ